jgi:hypothetical protein
MNQRRFFPIGWVVVAAICMAGMIVSNAQAFDGNRRGFFLGGGLGPGLTNFSQTVGYSIFSVTSDRVNKASFLTDFKIGYAPSDKYQIYYFNYVSWFGLDNVFGDNVMIGNGVGGLGLTFYTQPQAPSTYFNFGIGLSSWDAVSEDNGDTWWGVGIMLGGGYEFARHWALEGTFTYGHPSITEGGITASTDALAFGVKIIALAY